MSGGSAIRLEPIRKALGGGTVFVEVIRNVVGGTSFAGLVTGGLRTMTTLEALARATSGLTVTTPVEALVRASAGLRSSLLVSGQGTALTASGVRSGAVADNPTAARQTGAPRVERITIDLTGTYPSQTASSSGSWANPNNGNGNPNGVFATNANTALAAMTGDLTLAPVATMLGKTGLTITKVELKVYARYTPGLVAPCQVTIDHSIDSGGTYPYPYIQNGTTAFDQTGTPFILDITDKIAGNWSGIPAVRVKCGVLVGGASATPSTFSVDAMQIVVTASTTQVQ